MQVTLEATKGLERTLNITVAAEMFDKEFDGRVRHLAKTQRVDGFRAGKVPVSVITKRFGEAITHEVAGEMMQQNFYKAIMEEKLTPAGAPEVVPMPRVKGEDFIFKATFEVYPEIELKDLAELSVEVEKAEVTDADLDNMLVTLQKQHATWKEVKRKSKNDDQVTIDFVGSMDGEEFEGGKAEGFKLVLGAGQMIPGFESGIISNKAGDEFSIDVTFPEDYHAETLKGKTAQFAMKLTAVEEQVLPELNKEFVSKFGIESGELEDLKSDVKKNMTRELEQTLKNINKDKALNSLLEINEIEVPKALIASEVDVLRKQAIERYSKQMGVDNLPELPADLFSEQAEKRVKIGLLLGEVINVNELVVDDAKVSAFIENASSSYENPAEVVEHYKNNKDMMQNIQNITLEEQAIDLMIEKAKVSEVSKSFDEVMNKTA